MTDLRSDIEAIVDRHTIEWKAGHGHLIVTQILDTIEKHLPEEKVGTDVIPLYNKERGFNAAIQETKAMLRKKT